MSETFEWAGFVGAWLLVAGPVHQAVLELGSEEIEIDRLRALDAAIPTSPPLSAWWWLLPPVRLVLARRRAARHTQNALAALSDHDRAAITSYAEKAVGWLLVAGGGLLLALDETYRLADDHRAPATVFWLLTGVALTSCLGIVIGLRHRSRSARTRPSAS